MQPPEKRTLHFEINLHRKIKHGIGPIHPESGN